MFIYLHTASHIVYHIHTHSMYHYNVASFSHRNIISLIQRVLLSGQEGLGNVSLKSPDIRQQLSIRESRMFKSLSKLSTKLRKKSRISHFRAILVRLQEQRVDKQRNAADNYP